MSDVYKKLLDFIDMSNIATEGDIEEKTLEQIATDVIAGYEEDKSSRAEWEEKIEKAMKIAKQVVEPKSSPWENAANVKYPLITNAAIQFAARAFPEIIKGDRLVQVAIPTTSQINNLILNKTPQSPEEAQALEQMKQEDQKKVEEMEDIADLISKHMSFQLLVEDDEWEGEMDRLLHVLPITGLMYKKTFYDEDLERPRSIMCLPDDIIVNEDISSIDKAPRITHRIYLYPYQIKEYMRKELFSELDDSEFAMLCTSEVNIVNATIVDNAKPVEFLEQHCRIDLDEDGYSEPYIVTVAKKTKKVMRIVAGYIVDDIVRNVDGEVTQIKPTQYFTDFHFIRSPDGKFHSIGFGILLYPQNETINTLINQLLDAGTLSNRQSGFIGKGIRMSKGEIKLNPGQWLKVEATPGQDLKANIVPLPVREPSSVLMGLLQLIIKSGNDTANLSELLSGREKTQNSPGVTVLALLEQGLKVESSILKRVRRSLKKEFKKLFNINREYLSDDIVFADGNEFFTVTKDAYMLPNVHIYPVADPTMSSDAQRIARGEALMQYKDDPYFNPIKIRQNYLKALQIPDVEELVPAQDPNAEPTLADQFTMAQIKREEAHAAHFLAQAEAAPGRTASQLITSAGMASMNASLSSKAKMDAIMDIANLIAKLGIAPEQEAQQFITEALMDPSSQEVNNDQLANAMEIGMGAIAPPLAPPQQEMPGQPPMPEQSPIPQEGMPQQPQGGM